MSVTSVFELLDNTVAWSPRLPSMQLWNSWAEGVGELDPFEQNPELLQTPSVSFLPMSLRKKLSAVAKLGLFLMNETLDKEQAASLPIVMSSRHGESQTTVDILESIAKNEPMSPMSFSRSVHNSTVGMFSIANNNQSRNVAISGMEFSFGMGMIEAVTQLYADQDLEKILYVYVDEAVPVPFKPFIDNPPVNYGAAFILSKKEIASSLAEVLEGVAQIECLDFLQFALASA